MSARSTVVHSDGVDRADSSGGCPRVVRVGRRDAIYDVFALCGANDRDCYSIWKSGGAGFAAEHNFDALVFPLRHGDKCKAEIGDAAHAMERVKSCDAVAVR